MVAVLLDSGSDGEWATQQLEGASVSAPSLMPFEAANIIRRSEQARLVSSDVAAQAHADLLRRSLDLWSYESFAQRAWELRHNLTSYDASYVALAELIETPLVTLDRRIAKVRGLRCVVHSPR
jgi:predicted nucleic acid-binding protein